MRVMPRGRKATVTIRGKGFYAGIVAKKLKVYVPIKRTKVKPIGAQILTSSACRPKPVIKLGKAKLKLGRDYTLTYRNNASYGKATVIIKGKGYYTGQRKVTFAILTPGSGRTITQAECARIKRGMTRAQVNYVVGGPGWMTRSIEEITDYGDGATSRYYEARYEWDWADGSGRASVLFVGNRVSSKSR